MTSNPIDGELAAEFTDLYLVNVDIRAERCNRPGMFSLIIDEKEPNTLPKSFKALRINLSVKDLTQILWHLNKEDLKGLPIACDPDDIKK